MKSVIPILLGLVLILGTSSCKKCKNEDPRARIVNNGTEKISVQIQTSGGNTVNINNILTGEISDYASYAAGQIDFTISIGNLGDEFLSVVMEECWEYDIVVGTDNTISSIPTDRNE